MRFPATLAVAALVGVGAHPASARTLLVPQKCPTIQGAAAARPGDTVLVSPKPKGGVYGEAVVIIDSGAIGGALVSRNVVTGNQALGIYDYGYNYGSLAPTTFTQNVAVHNSLTPPPGTVGFDAVDGHSAPTNPPSTMQASSLVYGNAQPQYDIWTKNVFGRADPATIGR